ncbi:dihydrodipicolinate synthase family protein [Janthinobacterium sp. B9-8]|uniref:dihydrodipicolinate synthase family protein n=1 Tax=Janthinobacterium sp. B9-8 TaxID=1236179 RepID=UPI0012E3F9D0
MKILRFIQDGNLAAARIIDLQLRPLILLLFSEPNPALIKAAFTMHEFIHDELRLSMTPASPDRKSQLRILAI